MPYNHDEKSVLISIIVPVYNKERSLQNCIDSLDAQTIDKSLMEVILVNDGSTDESLSICERAAQRHSYIRVLSQKNQGVSAAVSYTHLRAHETGRNLVCRLLLEKKKS